MSQETFARVEKKYVISREQYEWIRQFLTEYTVEDEYGQSTIRNANLAVSCSRVLTSREEL